MSEFSGSIPTNQEKNKNLIADRDHAARAKVMMRKMETRFPDFSEKQVVYISVALTDNRMELDERLMVAFLGILSGPDLDRAVPEDELADALADGAGKYLLRVMQAEGGIH